MTRMLMRKTVQMAAKKIPSLQPSKNGTKVLTLSQQLIAVLLKVGRRLKAAMSTSSSKEDVIGLTLSHWSSFKLKTFGIMW